MKGTVPYNDPSISTPEVLQDETPVDSSQQGTINSSKVYTSAACLGLALASGMLFPKASEATTEPSETVSTSVIHPSTDSEHSAASTTPSVSPEAWQPSLLRGLSEMNRDSGLADQITAEDYKPLNKDIAEFESDPPEAPVSSELPTQRQVEPYSTIPSAPHSSGSATVEISRPSSYSWESDISAPAPQTVYTQTKTDESKFPRTSKFPGTVVIESDLSRRTPVSRVYNVTPGDTVAKIAIRHQISVKALIETNRLSNPNHIVVNQRLKIPHQQTISQDSKFEGSSGVRDGVSTAHQSLPDTAQTGTLFNRTVLPSVLPSEVKRPLVQKPLNVPLGTSVLSHMAAETGDRGEIALSTLALGRFQNKGAVPKPLATKLATPVIVDERRLTESAAIASVKRENLSVSDSKDFHSLETRNSTKVYTERLRSEVNRLRAEYQDKTRYQVVNASWEQADNEFVEVVAVPTMVQLADRLRRTNPEFAPQADKDATLQLAQAEPVAAELIVEQLQNAEELNQSESTDEVVATAPLSSSAYDPLKNPAIGRIVSPELPPLLGPDAYLPGGSNQFKGYTWPSQGILSSGYGWRWGRMHRGIDIAGPIGTPIVAAAPGVVSYAGWNSGGYGNLVEIVHPDGSLTLYAHNNRILVNKGQKVVQGQQISEMGSTGRSTGPHLHFEIHPSGAGAVNPMALLPQERSNLSQY